MKALILISSIFYILGLKISNKIDLVKKSNPVEKIIIHNVKVAEPEKNATFESNTKEETPKKEKTIAKESME
ncbi:hypothetical protein [Draconibacterium halophilum]|uniref:Uncharacterized protein n=1 Tax=Draconibacterium halophilum TaxID=2706887 RepID=A0A6C0RDE1_9BACT|nr:hypothetical protein [Draconibacterium halophilum]QIA07922.1 hypothetical protein G0Q07_09360 [Draconibacterium halophilum]